MATACTNCTTCFVSANIRQHRFNTIQPGTQVIPQQLASSTTLASIARQRNIEDHRRCFNTI